MRENEILGGNTKMDILIVCPSKSRDGLVTLIIRSSFSTTRDGKHSQV